MKHIANIYLRKENSYENELVETTKGLPSQIQVESYIEKKYGTINVWDWTIETDLEINKNGKLQRVKVHNIVIVEKVNE